MATLKKYTQGSVFLIVLGIMVLVNIYIAIMPRIVVYMQNIALVREQHIQAIYALEGGLLMALAWCKMNTSFLSSMIEPTYVLYEGLWPWNSMKQGYSMCIMIHNIKKKNYLIEATLYLNNNIVGTQNLSYTFNADIT